MKNKTCCCCTTKLDKGVEFNNKTYCVECYNSTLVDLKLDRVVSYSKSSGNMSKTDYSEFSDGWDNE